MNRKSLATSVGIGTVAAVIALIAFFPSKKGNAVGPELVGQMQNFVLANRLVERPEISWKDAQGKNFSLADFDGKVVLFNYWASWCAPCQRELPGIDRLQAKMGGDNFTVVALNIDKGGKRVAMKNAIRLNLKNLKLFIDPKQETARKLGLRAMPSTFLFDRKGNLLGKMESGAEWDTPEAIALLNYFISKPDYSNGLNRQEI